jgi:hypothetical protein
MNGTLSRGKSSEKKEKELKDPGAGKSGNSQSQRQPSLLLVRPKMRSKIER